jgi:putative ABC transport system permease protein
MIRIWLRGLITRRPGPLLATVAGVMIAVALLASLGSFLASAQASMTTRAASGIAVDWQVQVASGSSATAVRRVVLAAPGVTAALPVGFAQTTGLTASVHGTTQSTGPGVVLGIPADYASTFPRQIRFLTGKRTGVLIAQQTASNLHIAPGDTVTIGLAGSKALTVTVAGVVDLPQANSLFQTVGAPASLQPNAPPDNVLLIPNADFAKARTVLLPVHPELVSTQIHVARSHALPADPSVSFVAVTGAAHNLEAKLAGAGRVGDNLGASLDAARGDSSYATVLFLFLGLPGAVLAGILTVAVANSGSDRRRREQALLRTRGASPRLVARLVTAEAVVVGIVGGALGLALSAAIGAIAFGSASFGASVGSAILWPVGSFLAGLSIAVIAVIVPAVRDFRSMIVSEARAQIGIRRKPIWMSFYLDFVLLAVATVVLFITTQSGYSLVLAPEGVASIQVNYWAFFGPGLLWIGAGLLIWRIARFLLGRATPLLTGFVRPITGNLAPIAASSMSRQRSMLSRATVMLALALAFAGSTAIFNSTYQQQAEVDARLTNGADVTVTEPPGSSVLPAAGSAISDVAGVKSVEPLQHRYAYVGSDLQDLFGVRATSIAAATSLQDAYFQEGTAAELMAKLAAQPDAILVSAETVKDFQLHPGELITLRLQNASTQKLVTVKFHYVGVANEFPTAPKDSFFIANSDYVTKMTRDASVGSFLVNTGGQSSNTVAAALRHKLGSSATVAPISAARSSVGSSLTSVDLAGLTRVELAFALLLAAAAGGLVFALGLAERRRTFAIASVLGANPRQLRGLVLAEAAAVAVGGTVAGASLGLILSQLLVSVLTGVFDPPPTGLTVPVPYLLAVIVIALGAIAGAAVLSARGSRRPPIETLRDI